MRPNTAKSAELQIMIWFLEAGWELFTPLSDLNATDMVVRPPESDELIAIQVKHKQPGSQNEGYLYNAWRDGKAPFHDLVFYQVQKSRGLVLPRAAFSGKGQTLQFFKFDTAGYSRGAVRPLFESYAFDLSAVSFPERSASFVAHFLSVHQDAA